MSNNSMLKYVKISSNQGGPFTTPSNRMIDLVIPEGQQVNLAQTYIDLLVHINGTDDTKVQNYCVRHPGNKVIPYNLDLIRNVWMTGDRCGALENVKRCNILNHNLKELSKGSVEKMSLVDSLYGSKGFKDDYLLSPFVEFHKVGSVTSAYRDLHLRIPLSDLFSLGSVQVLDTAKTGNVRIHLELENLSKIGLFIEPLFRDGEHILNDQLFVDLNPGDLFNQIVTGRTFESVENSPYFVGQHIDISFIPEIAGAPQPNEAIEDATITGIAYSSATGLITLTLDKSFPAMEGGVDLYTTITAGEKFFEEDVSFAVMTCELGVAQYGVSQKSPDVLTYMTFTTEEYSAGSNSVFLNKVFELEPNCVNTLLMFNDDQESNPISTNVHLDSYRCRNDNLDVYDRDILVNQLTGKAIKNHLTHESLHYDSINRTMLNAGIPFRNATLMAMVQETAYPYYNEIRFGNDGSFDDNKIMVIAAPVPLTGTTKKFQYNLTNKTGYVINDVILFKQVMKTVNL